jgi:hypothetical protein
MVAFVAIIGIVGYIQMRSDRPMVSGLPAPTHPLLKPEPGMLLSQTDLGLTDKQRSAIQTIEKSWSADRARLLAAMQSYEPKRGRVDQISGNLAGYSELSRSYDETRTRYWSMASGQLDTHQKARLEGASK